MDGFADLLTDAFSESSVPSFSDGDLDFENLNVDEKGEEDKADNLTTKSAEALLQEATSENEVSLDKATTDTLLTTADAYEEQTDDEEDEVNFMSEAPADEYSSSGEEGSSSGEDAEMDAGMTEEPGDLLMSVCSSENLQDATKDDRIFAERQPVASDGAHDPKVSNKVEDEAESDEEVSDVEEIPVQEDEMMMKSADEREREEESSDSEPEGLNEEQEENALQQEDQTYKINPVEDGLEFPSLSLQNLQDLITEVDGEEYVDKIADFTEDEHQEAGESFADYPSDFSSGEYTRDEGKNEEKVLTASHHTQQEGAVTESPWPLRAEDTEKDEGFLYSRDLEMNADEMTTLEVAAEQQEERKSESDEGTSNSSSDDEESLRRCDEVSDNISVQDGENYKKLESIQLHDYSSAEFSRWSLSDDHNRNDRADLTDFIRSEFDVLKSDTLLSEYLFTTEDSDDETDDTPSGVNQCPVEDGSHSVVEKDEANPTTYNQGSIDDSFFFDTELDTSEVPEVRQLTDQEYEERRNYEQMQERIEAFKRFYDNSDEENGGEERQIKVQFCADPLSQIIHYETDSSDQESFSSYSDREEEEEDDYDEEEEEEEEEERMEEEGEQEKLEEGKKVEEEEEEEEKAEEEEEENLLGDEEENVEEEEEQENVEEDEKEEEEEDKVEEKEEEEENLLEGEEKVKMEEKKKEEDLSSAEIFDEPMEPEDSLHMNPVCNPANVQLSQKLSEVRETQTCTKTHKGLGVLKTMVKLGVVTAMGLMMFWLISDQPDWLRDVFSV